MIQAAEYACRQASAYAQSAGVFYCSAPEQNAWEIATAIGTIGATLAAVTFGIVEIARSRKERRKNAIETRRQLLNSQFQKVSAIMADMAEIFPTNTSAHSNRFHAQVAIYEDLLFADLGTSAEIKRLASALFTKFGRIALQNNVQNCRKTAAIYNVNVRNGIDAQILPGTILRMLSMRIETALSAWHLTGLGTESVVAELRDIESEMAEYDNRINEFQKLWEGGAE